MVCPHQEKFHALVVGGFEEAVVQRAFEERPVLVPVPVVHEHVDSGGEGGVDFARDGYRVCLVFIAPQRDNRLFVPVEFRPGFVDVLPLSRAVRENPELLPARFGVVGGPDYRGNVVFGFCGGGGISRLRRAPVAGRVGSFRLRRAGRDKRANYRQNAVFYHIGILVLY